MEGSESEAVFDAHNLNPQLFINEILNTTDYMIEGAFDFFLQEASKITSAGGSDEVSQGVSSLHQTLQSAVDKRMDMWDKYCLRSCFTVPEGTSSRIDQNSSPMDLSVGETVYDQELDNQLDNLRTMLAEVSQETADLLKEKRSLEVSTTSHISDSLATEALQQLEQNSVQQMFKETGKTASILRLKMNELNMRRRVVKQGKVGATISPFEDGVYDHETGIPASTENIQECADILKRA